ncbi:ATP-binding protein [Candidatus Deferrimicrobium sp.]|uniref:ATP-binding protein n=1 Tax=Candidatus Deferrimicrobium sp. TaxID=3060586 RepID=UPI003C4F5705
MSRKEGNPHLDLADQATSLEGRYERIQAVESTRKALLARRRYSLRLHIYLGFFLVFLFVVGVATAMMITMYEVENKLSFLEIANEYMLEIQQARRFEKNFFLYGTNLNDALENVNKAKQIFDDNREEIRKILGKDSQAIILSNFKRYEVLLERLVDLEQTKGKNPDYPPRKKEIEVELRRHGQEMVSLANQLMKKEKESLSEAILRSRHIHMYSLIFLLFFLVLNATLLGSRIMGPIQRFSVYAKRIASGDFSPITPGRRFRDEFTDLAIAINQMIQELETREAVLIQSHKMRAIGTLTAGVAHELNNPLNNITITAHMLLEDYDHLSDEERKEMVRDVVNEAGRSKVIISDLLDFARESGSQLEPLDLPELLRETINLASNQIKLSGIKIELQGRGHLPRIHGDRQQLRQVFLNLILNAIDASSKGGKIQVLVVPADEPSNVAVKIIDFGSGIPEKILDSIFDPFFTTKAGGKGTGLGLSVSQGIVAKHGGRILVTSVQGKGSTFTVTLPVTTIPADIDSSDNLPGEVTHEAGRILRSGP